MDPGINPRRFSCIVVFQSHNSVRYPLEGRVEKKRREPFVPDMEMGAATLGRILRGLDGCFGHRPGKRMVGVGDDISWWRAVGMNVLSNSNGTLDERLSRDICLTSHRYSLSKL